MNNIAGVVILYNPSANVVSNINTYIKYVNVLYVVLNSKVSRDILEYISNKNNIIIIKHKKNEGIAKSLNEILNLVKGKYDWLLTMDQDSLFLSEKVEQYLSIVEKLEDDSIYGITSMITCNKVIEKGRDYDYIDRCITSGMILNVRIALECDGFCEKLFIDEVDYEFCYRANERGYKLIKYPYKIMEHHIGCEEKHNFLGYTFYTENEKYFRLYYIFRNCLFIIGRYRKYRKIYIMVLFKRMVKIILSEDDKIRKVKYALKGIKAYFYNEMGALKERK